MYSPILEKKFHTDKKYYLGPWQMSRRRTMFGWLYLPRCLSKLISRNTFIGTPSSPSWIFTFFIATTVSVFRSRALYTVA